MGEPEPRLGVWPHPLKLVRGLRRPSEPFVMINLLRFREQATGKYSAMSGREAYDLYAESVVEIQGPMGSKLYWAGEVEECYGAETPSFDVVAFLQYPSPRDFFRFATRGGSRTDARKAGLEGQWLVASTTLTHAPAGAGPVLVELVTGEPWVDDGDLVWSGRCDQQIIGSGPRMGQVIATAFDDLASLETGLAARRDSRPADATTWWAYRATTSDFAGALQ